MHGASDSELLRSFFSKSSETLTPSPFLTGFPFYSPIPSPLNDEDGPVDLATYPSRAGIVARIRREIRRRSIGSKFPHRDIIIPSSLDGMYDDLLVFSRSTFLNPRVNSWARNILYVQIRKGSTSKLNQAMGRLIISERLALLYDLCRAQWLPPYGGSKSDEELLWRIADLAKPILSEMTNLSGYQSLISGLLNPDSSAKLAALSIHFSTDIQYSAPWISRLAKLCDNVLGASEDFQYLTSSLMHQRRYQEAEMIYRHCMQVTTDALEGYHIDAKRLRDQLASCLILRAYSAPALSIRQRVAVTEAEVIYRQGLGGIEGGDDTFCTEMCRLAANLRDERRFDEAVSVYERALDILDTTVPYTRDNWERFMRRLQCARCDVRTIMHC